MSGRIIFKIYILEKLQQIFQVTMINKALGGENNEEEKK